MKFDGEQRVGVQVSPKNRYRSSVYRLQNLNSCANVDCAQCLMFDGKTFQHSPMNRRGASSRWTQTANIDCIKQAKNDDDNDMR